MSDVTCALLSAATAKVQGRQATANTNSLIKVEFIVVVPMVVESWRCVCRISSRLCMLGQKLIGPIVDIRITLELSKTTPSIGGISRSHQDGLNALV